MRKRPVASRGVFLSGAVFLTLLFISSGCEYLKPTPVPQKPRGPFYFDASYDEVWEAAVETVTDLGFRIISMNKTEGFFVTDEKSGGCYGKCYQRFGDSLTVMLKRFNSFVSVTPVQSVTSYKYTYPNEASAEPIAVIATKMGRLIGEYESEVGEGVAKKLGKPFLLSLPEK